MRKVWVAACPGGRRQQVRAHENQDLAFVFALGVGAGELAENGDARNSGQAGDGERLIAIDQAGDRRPLTELEFGFGFEDAAGDDRNPIERAAA